MRNETEIVLYHQQSEHVYLPVLVSAAAVDTACDNNTMGFLEIILSRFFTLSYVFLETSCDLRYSKSERIAEEKYQK